eukprot:TRINITY_DN6621_c0_g1_i3.p1 TRINITY_DN6621_c0_g1~~TRINITY_DN6621_c0_g1_i3.p1  ORF type:complete len:470 (-),score=133.99 TRINITY_DN6621_c0_g1_i3:743-2152(-)
MSLTQADVERILTFVPQEKVPEFLSNLCALLNIKATPNQAPEEETGQISLPPSASEGPTAPSSVISPALITKMLDTAQGPKNIKDKPQVVHPRIGARRKNAPRRCWSPELHRHFVIAWQTIAESGNQPSPKKIMVVMAQNGAPMEDLTIRQVQSHHQKYKLKMQKAKEAMSSALSEQDMHEALTPRSLAASSMGWSLTPSTSMESNGSEYSDDELDDGQYSSLAQSLCGSVSFESTGQYSGLAQALCGSMSFESTGSDVGEWTGNGAWLASVSASSSTSIPDWHAPAVTEDWAAGLGLAQSAPVCLPPTPSDSARSGDALNLDTLRAFGLAGLRTSGLTAPPTPNATPLTVASDASDLSTPAGDAPVSPLFGSGSYLSLSSPLLFSSDTMKMLDSGNVLTNSAGMSWSPMLSLRNSLSANPLVESGTAYDEFSAPFELPPSLNTVFDLTPIDDWHGMSASVTVLGQAQQ